MDTGRVIDVARVSRRLHRPIAKVDLLRLTEQWRTSDVVVWCQKPAQFDDWPDLPARLRGAWGWQLLGAARGSRVPEESTPPLARLFLRCLARLETGGPVSSPFVFHVCESGGKIEIRLRLFGFAGAWLQQAERALGDALDGGVSIANEIRVQAKLRAQRTTTVRMEGLEVPSEARVVALRFRTPLQIRRRNTLVTSMHALLPSLVCRVNALAPWQDLAVDEAERQIVDELRGLQYDTHRMGVVAWTRRSGAQGRAPIPMVGIGGNLLVRGRMSQNLLALLKLGENCNVGSHAALGLGHYELEVIE